MDWFLYDNGLRHERVNQNINFKQKHLGNYNYLFLQNLKHTLDTQGLCYTKK